MKDITLWQMFLSLPPGDRFFWGATLIVAAILGGFMLVEIGTLSWRWMHDVFGERHDDSRSQRVLPPAA